MKKKMKCLTGLLLGAALASQAFVGVQAEEEEITITLWHQSVADTDPVKQIIEDAVVEYHELHPNTTFEQDAVTGEHYKT